MDIFCMTAVEVRPSIKPLLALLMCFHLVIGIFSVRLCEIFVSLSQLQHVIIEHNLLTEIFPEPGVL